MVPPEFLVMYLAANVIGAALLLLAFWRPGATRWAVVAVFVWASITNARTALTIPLVYLDYGTLTPSAIYRQFIGGWFASHIQSMVLLIAAGQALIALTIAGPRRWRWIGVTGALVFLAAIAPLGIGSGFPFSLTFGAAVFVMHRRGARSSAEDTGSRDARVSSSPLTPFIPHPDVREQHELIVHAPAAIAMTTAERFDMHSIWIVSAIFRLRAWFMHAIPPPRRWSRGLMDEVRTLGWGELARQHERFVVMGAVAQPWIGNVRFQAVSPSEFREYSGPAQVKIAWTLEAIPLGDGRTRLRTETRVVATDAEARRLFLRYWRFARFGIIGIRWLLLPAIRRDAERSARQPGDSNRAA